MYLALVYAVLIVTPFLPISKRFLFRDTEIKKCIVFMDITVTNEGNNKHFLNNTYEINVRMQDDMILDPDSKASRRSIVGRAEYFSDELFEFFYTFDDFVEDLCKEHRLDMVQLILKSNKFSYVDDFIVNDKLEVTDIADTYGAINTEQSFIPEKDSKAIFNCVQEFYQI